MPDSTPSQNTLSPEAIIGIVAVIIAVPSFGVIFYQCWPVVQRAITRTSWPPVINGALTRPRNGGQSLLPLYSPSIMATTASSSAGSAYRPNDHSNNPDCQQHRLVVLSMYEESSIHHLNQEGIQRGDA